MQCGISGWSVIDYLISGFYRLSFFIQGFFELVYLQKNIDDTYEEIENYFTGSDNLEF